MKQILCILSVFFLSTISSPAFAKTSALELCVRSYCSDSCSKTVTCGYLAASGKRSCERSCRPKARTSLAGKGSRALSTCRANVTKFNALSCITLGRLLGVGSSGGGKK